MGEAGHRALRYAPIGELRAALRRRDVSAVELARAACDLLAEQGVPLNAVARITRELAEAQAQRADQEMREGIDRGPLHGIPYGAKDLLDTAGIATEYGSPTHARRVPEGDAAVIELLREAGAVLVAKLTMIPLAGGGGYGGPGASLGGPVRTPWNTAHWAGGSSSGSGAAVGAGVIPFSIGSETWGSIVCPAAYCGVSGLRPTYGRVPRAGAMILSWTMDKLGPLAHSAEDCGLVLQALLSRPAVPPAVGGQAQDRPLTGLRAGIAAGDLAAHDPATAHLFRAAVTALQDLGMSVEEGITVTSYPADAVAATVIKAEGSAAFAPLIRSAAIDTLPDAAPRRGLRSGRAVTAEEFITAMRVRAEIQTGVAELFRRFDILLGPTYLGVAPRVDEPFRGDAIQEHASLGAVGNLCGLPALSVPMGFGAEGLPLGLCIVGNAHAEDTLVSVGQAYQRATDWHLRRPLELAAGEDPGL
ncbi:MAG: amidase [Chloroflexota bacterium]